MMPWQAHSILITSILFQAAAAFLAMRLLWITKKKTTWVFIAVAIVLMAARRCSTLYEWLSRNTLLLQIDVTTEIIALATSSLMVVGIALAEPLFKAGKQAEETIRGLRNRFDLILNSAWGGTLGLDSNGNHAFVNPAAARMLGYEIEELIGKHSHSTWHHSKSDGSSYPEEECPIYDTFRKGTKYHVRNEVFWRKDGTSFPVAYTGAPIIEEGKIVGVVVTFWDITDRKQAEEALRDSEKKYRLLVNQVPAIVYKGYADWSVDLFDDKVEAVTGYSKEEFNLRRLTWADLLFDEDKNAAKELFVRALKSNGEYVREFRIRSKEGKTIWIYERGCIVCNQNGRIAYISGIFFDITERKRIENELRDYREHLEELVEKRTSELSTANKQLKREIAERKQITMEIENLIGKLQDALSQVRTLKGLLPICANCKNIRNDDGYWQSVESYLHDHSEAEFSHGICPDCCEKLYPDFCDEGSGEGD